MKKYFIVIFLASIQSLIAQTTFDYNVVLNPVSVSGLPGLHSYAFGQHNGKWLIIGGRKDGVHARQPFNSFPGAQNNTDISVVDIATQQSWSASVNSLPVGIKEQLQSTNMNFYQDGDALFIIGGYAYAASADDHNKSVIENALKKAFAPEFLNRIDDVIVFNALEKHDIDLIIEIELKKLTARIADLGYTLNLSDKAKSFIAEKGFDKQFGARPLKRAIQKYVEDSLAEEIITSKIGSGDEIFMDIEDGAQELTVQVHKAEKPTS